MDGADRMGRLLLEPPEYRDMKDVDDDALSVGGASRSPPPPPPPPPPPVERRGVDGADRDVTFVDGRVKPLPNRRNVADTMAVALGGCAVLLLLLLFEMVGFGKSSGRKSKVGKESPATIWCRWC